MKIRRMLILVIVSLLTVSAVGYGQPNPARFDSLLKTNWYGIYMQGMKMGYFELALEKIDTPVVGWRYFAKMTIIMKVGETESKMITDDTKIYMAPKGELYSSSLVITSPTGNIKVNGHIDSTKYLVESDIGGQKSTKSFNYPLDYLDSVLVVEMRIISGKAAVGDSFIASSFEATPPLTGLIHQVIKFKAKQEYIFNGLATSAFAIEGTILEANMTIEGLTDNYGNGLEMNMGNVMTLKLEDEVTAKNLSTSFDMITDNLVIPDKKLDNSTRLKSLRLKITGIDSTGLLNTNMQKVKTIADGLELENTAQKIPQNSLAIPISQADVEAYLKSDPYEQSDDPQIIELTKSIVAGEKNSWEAARKINVWVYENIEKKYTPDLSNALQTLNSRRGDCGEHTALAVALLRAAGIPARPIVGLMYWEPGGGFGYHAWVEAYVGSWVQMDPTWNQELASPSHIALTRGDIISQVSVLMKVMGKMKIEILEAE